MYESFFQLAARPFLSSPMADRYFPAASVEHARETVTRCVERAEGPALILGPAGTGKSTLCHVIAQQMRERLPGGHVGQCPVVHASRSAAEHPVRTQAAVSGPRRGGAASVVDRCAGAQRRVPARHGADRGRSAHVALAAAGRDPHDHQPGAAGPTAGAPGAGRRHGAR